MVKTSRHTYTYIKLSHTEMLFCFFFPFHSHSLFFGHIFLDCGFYILVKTQTVVTQMNMRADKDKLQQKTLHLISLITRAGRGVGKKSDRERERDRQADRQLRWGDERRKWKQDDWQCLNCEVTCTPGSRVSSLKRGDQNKFKARRGGRGWEEGKEQERLNQKLGIGRKENHVPAPPTPPSSNALAERQKRAERSQQYFFSIYTCTGLPSQAVSPVNTSAKSSLPDQRKQVVSTTATN